MIMIHLSQHVDGVRIKGKIRIIHHTQSKKLVTKSAFSEYKLRCVSAVQTVNTICTAYSILKRYSGPVRNAKEPNSISNNTDKKSHDLLRISTKQLPDGFRTRVKKSCQCDRLFCKVFKDRGNTISAGGFQSSALPFPSNFWFVMRWRGR